MVKNRVRHYDVAKGIGIILVVLGHSMIEFGHYIIYMFHMPLFFFISGVFFKPEPTGKMLLKQTRNLLVPFVFFTSVIMIIAVLSDCKAMLTWIPPHMQGLIGSMWFLWVLFLVVNLHNMIALHLKAYGVLAVAFLLTLFGYAADRLNLPNYGYVYSCISLLVFYSLGWISGKKFGALSLRSLKAMFAISFVAMIGLYLLSYKVLHLDCTDLFDNSHAANFFVWLSGSVVGIVMVASLSMLIDRADIAASILALIGTSSLYIFAFHELILYMLHRVVVNPSDLVEMAFVGLAVVLGLLSRYPLRRTVPQIFR